MLVFTGVLGLTIVFGWCYKESTLDRTFQRNEKLLTADKLLESEKRIADAVEKNMEKRRLYEQKYPDMAKK